MGIVDGPADCSYWEILLDGTFGICRLVGNPVFRSLDRARLPAEASEIRSAAPPSVPASVGPRIPPRPEFYDFALLERPAATNIAFDSRARSDLDRVVFDTTTTGLRPIADALVAIAGVRIVNGPVRRPRPRPAAYDRAPGRGIRPFEASSGPPHYSQVTYSAARIRLHALIPGVERWGGFSGLPDSVV